MAKMTGGEALAQTLKEWSLSEQLRDFCRGVISLPGAVFFLSIAGVCLYLAMVLIGRRHWAGGRDGNSMGWHYLVRVLAAQPDAPPLEAGEVVSTGTLTDAHPVAAGETWSTELEGLPLPGMTVRFS